MHTNVSKSMSNNIQANTVIQSSSTGIMKFVISLLAHLLKEICYDVCVEPGLQGAFTRENGRQTRTFFTLRHAQQKRYTESWQ